MKQLLQLCAMTPNLEKALAERFTVHRYYEEQASASTRWTLNIPNGAAGDPNMAHDLKTVRWTNAR